MSARPEKVDCAAVRRELLRYEGPLDVSLPRALRAHLDACTGCRAEWVEQRELLAALRAALAPEPLPKSTVRQIETRLLQRHVRRYRPALLRAAGVAVAAGIVGVLLLPSRTDQPSQPVEKPAAGVTITADDAAAIAAAVGVLTWDSPVDYSLNGLAERVQDTAQQLGRERGSTTLLPWSAEDDWDMPGGTGESSQGPALRWTCREAETIQSA